MNLTMSIGVKEVPGFPPIVPLMPEIDLINAIDDKTFNNIVAAKISH